MPTMLHPLGPLMREVRMHGPILLSGVPEPHDELMSLVWGPRFDREHALGLVARQPAVAALALPGLLAAADAFDALHMEAKQRLRELIRRHRTLSAAPTASGDRVRESGLPQAASGASTRETGMVGEAEAHWSMAPVACRAVSASPPGPGGRLPV